MKSILIFIIISLNFITFSQTLTQEEKQAIINNLDSTKYWVREKAILDILQYKISEALPVLEQKIFTQERGIASLYLDGLFRFNSDLAVEYAHKFIDTVEYLPDIPGIVPETPDGYGMNFKKYKAAILLFERNDFSRADIIISWIDFVKPQITAYMPLLLGQILNNVPQYEGTAKNELLRIANSSEAEEYSSRAVKYLGEYYGEAIIPELLSTYSNNHYDLTRMYILGYLDRFNYPDYENFLKENFSSDTTVAGEILQELLHKYPSPANYNFIMNNMGSALTPFYQDFYSIWLTESYEPTPPNVLSTILEFIEYTRSLCDTLLRYTWLADLQFKNELQTILETAKTNLLAGDSLACAVDVKSFQDSVDFVYKDSLNTDPRFVTLEGWKFLYWNAQYTLDRLPEIPAAEGINTYSVFATHGVWLEQNSEVISGNIGVNEIGQPPFMDSDVEMSIGISTVTPAGYTIKANRIKVKQGAAVNSDVYYNELDNNGTITGTLNTPLELPLFAALPEFHQSTPGTENIVVPQNGEYTLAPGAYGDIQVKKNGKLIFTGGEYNINNFNGGNNNQLIFQSESEVRIKDKFDSGQDSYIGPEDTTTLSADEIVFYVEGINGSNGNLGATPKAAKIGINNTVKANFYVPNGTLWIRQNSEAEGSFIGKDVDVGIGVDVKLDSAF